MTYLDACNYLFNQMPMFERQGASGYKEGLSNTLALDDHFGHPHQSFKTIHVAGTNGKGSVSHTLAAVLQECGYRVGLYTSPHLVDFRERIRVNGQEIPEDYVVDFVEQERAFFEPLHPSFFEVTTALAFKYFRERRVDIAVVEVGLGGRLDCTNIIEPLLSVITNISFDHTQFLGDTLAKIAGEKAGIIKRHTPVVIGEATEETRPVFEAKAREMDAPIIFAEDNPQVEEGECTSSGMRYFTKNYGELTGDLGGIYQIKNLNTVLHALQVLEQQGYLVLKNSQQECLPELQKALMNVSKSTGLMGRWQCVKEQPKVICDTGHNVGGWQYISEQLKKTPHRKLHIVFGMVSDKDVKSVLRILPKEAIYYFTKADNHRALKETTLLEMAQKFGLTGMSFPTVHDAYQAALGHAYHEDLIFVGGSSYVVGDFLKSCC